MAALFRLRCWSFRELFKFALIVYDFSCDNHRIIVGKNEFADFAETDDFFATQEEAIKLLNSEENKAHA